MIGPLRYRRSRWGLQWLWLRHSYPFHWAHKPLCERFRHDVLRIGTLHVCRSCTMACCGFGVGALLCGLSWQLVEQTGAALLLTLATLTILLSFPTWYGNWPRPMRDIVRLAMGVTIALCACLLLSGQLLAGLIGAAALATFWKAYIVLRSRRRLTACAGCAELNDDAICTGFTLQAECVRRYEAAATERIIASGYRPPAVRDEPRR